MPYIPYFLVYRFSGYLKIFRLYIILALKPIAAINIYLFVFSLPRDLEENALGDKFEDLT